MPAVSFFLIVLSRRGQMLRRSECGIPSETSSSNLPDLNSMVFRQIPAHINLPDLYSMVYRQIPAHINLPDLYSMIFSQIPAHINLPDLYSMVFRQISAHINLPDLYSMVFRPTLITNLRDLYIYIVWYSAGDQHILQKRKVQYYQ